MNNILKFIEDFRGDNLDLPEDSKDKIVDFTLATQKVHYF